MHMNKLVTFFFIGYMHICIWISKNEKYEKGWLLDTWTKKKYSLASFFLKTLWNEHSDEKLTLTVTQPKSLPITSLLQGEWTLSWITATSWLRASPLCHLVGYLGAVLKTLNDNETKLFFTICLHIKINWPELI